MSHERILEMMRDTCVACECDWPCDDKTEDGHGPMLSDSDMVWAICGRCHGDGWLGGYPGWYTQTDFAEDPDLFEDYMNRRRTCEDCRGAGKVRELTAEARSRPDVDAWIRADYEIDATYAQERAMGA